MTLVVLIFVWNFGCITIISSSLFLRVYILLEGWFSSKSKRHDDGCLSQGQFCEQIAGVTQLTGHFWPQPLRCSAAGKRQQV